VDGGKQLLWHSCLEKMESCLRYYGTFQWFHKNKPIGSEFIKVRRILIVCIA